MSKFTIIKTVIENWEISDCPNCRVPSKVKEDILKNNVHRIWVECPECGCRGGYSEYQGTSSIDLINRSARACILAITNWENLNIAGGQKEDVEIEKKAT